METTMTLQEQLDRIRAGAKIRIPEENRAIMRKATELLNCSGKPGRVPKVGDPAPDFILPDSTGSTWNSRALRRDGALLVTFFRGHW
jgi:hypothetical protein